MFFTNNNNNRPGGNNQGSVNTGIHTYFCDACTFSIGCWDDKLTIKYLPAIGKDERGYTRYDRDNRISTSLSLVKAAALVKKYQKKILPILMEKEEAHDVSFGVPIKSSNGAKCMLILSYRKDENDEYSAYISFARGIGEDGKCAPENIINYKFNKTPVYENINFETGDTVNSYEEGELYEIMDILKSRVLMTGLNAHSHRYSALFKKNAGGNNQQMNNTQPTGDMNSFDPSEFSQFQ